MLTVIDHQHVLGNTHDEWEIKNTSGLQAYKAQQYEQAIQLFKEALLTIPEEEQPNSRQAMTLNNVAAAHEALGRYDEAELYYQQSLTVVERIQGPNHPDLLPGLKNLAILHREQRNFDQAERLYQRSVFIIQHILGNSHPHLIPGLLDLAHVSQAQGEYGRAEGYYERALAIGEAELAPAHHQTQTIRMQYANLLRHLNRIDDAEELERRARRGLENPGNYSESK
ncbi:MAG: tetratricopeptide repeat protein [Nitrospira sp.]|nr:tetratricopeptide repeat protein [Nitrospira sp.]